jgi:hypothetical protein
VPTACALLKHKCSGRLFLHILSALLKEVSDRRNNVCVVRRNLNVAGFAND